MAPAQIPQELYLNRELSWIRFNQRVLAQALNPRTPLLEQAKFSAIFSNNLDEFFMVRVASLQSQLHAGVQTLSEDGLTPRQQLDQIRRQLEPLLQQQQDHYRGRLKTNLAEQGILLLDYEQLSRKQKDWANSYFHTSVFPVLTPLAVDPAHPFPFISNLSLNIAVTIRDPNTQQRQFARIKIPQKNLPRFVSLPPELHGGRTPQPVFMGLPLEQLVAFNLQRLFPGMLIEGHHFFRITRDADLELRELEADDLMEALEQGLRKRRMGGEVVRLEVADEMPLELVEQLMRGMEVDDFDVFRINGPLGLDDLMGLLAIEAPQLKDAPFRGRTPLQLRTTQSSQLEDGSLQYQDFESIFRVIRRGDVLLHHPFDLFTTSVEEFINQAADDPHVLAIKMTLYRVSKNSPIIAALIRAAENGKQVMTLVELKARFDEDNNIQWARQLERAGVHVVYGVLGLKTHTKITLVVRREQEKLQGYCHIGTGNYNSKTSSLYTDLGILSCNDDLVSDLVDLFNYLTGFSKQQHFRHLLVAPVTLRRRMQELIQREIDHARAGKPAAIKAKMNALVDPGIISLLYEASQAGVSIDLVVRGMCSLRPGVEGISNNIRVISVIGRLLEHSRLFWFANAGEPDLFLGSADWMPRNLDRRVEAVVPVLDGSLCMQLEWLVQLYLDDPQAWLMQADGTYVVRNPEAEGPLAQRELMELWSLRNAPGEVPARLASTPGAAATAVPCDPAATDPTTTGQTALADQPVG
ncbi:MAG: polyphosphate kinase 1 [Vulcanococcus sp.]|uniref:polyphosphate kinase 1 n=1 Tax=Vulcanococcus sp. TaxID=2856995 RepID=UPI0025E38FCF|nr:polyphosphate kinase 1 [Vulcanococcus sp.]MBW0166836.1 polyphosphate kinase 1 [Vulcanococcus sp.]